jgi:hypothetical protein
MRRKYNYYKVPKKPISSLSSPGKTLPSLHLAVYVLLFSYLHHSQYPSMT